MNPHIPECRAAHAHRFRNIEASDSVLYLSKKTVSQQELLCQQQHHAVDLTRNPNTILHHDVQSWGGEFSTLLCFLLEMHSQKTPFASHWPKTLNLKDTAATETEFKKQQSHHCTAYLDSTWVEPHTTMKQEAWNAPPEKQSALHVSIDCSVRQVGTQKKTDPAWMGIFLPPALSKCSCLKAFSICLDEGAGVNSIANTVRVTAELFSKTALNKPNQLTKTHKQSTYAQVSSNRWLLLPVCYFHADHILFMCTVNLQYPHIEISN